MSYLYTGLISRYKTLLFNRCIVYYLRKIERSFNKDVGGREAPDSSQRIAWPAG